MRGAVRAAGGGFPLLVRPSLAPACPPPRRLGPGPDRFPGRVGTSQTQHCPALGILGQAVVTVEPELCFRHRPQKYGSLRLRVKPGPLSDNGRQIQSLDEVFVIERPFLTDCTFTQ
jgi:hypothetical protein